MKITFQNAVSFILVAVIAVLCLLLIQSQTIIEDQRNTIAIQEAQIKELETEVAKLSQLTPEKIINDAKSIIKNEDINFLNTFSEKVLQQ